MSAANWYATGKTVRLLDLPVFYKRAGSGPNLLCIHGFPSTSWDFEPIWPGLTTRFDVIAHDLIGLGRSAKPKQPLPIRLQADVIEELLLQQHISEAHLLAHDLGDTVAQELLARQSEGASRVNWLSCVFLNGGIFPETHRPLLIQKLMLSPLGPLIVHFMSRKSLAQSFHRIFSDAHPPSEEFIRETWDLMALNDGRSMIPRLIKYMEERRTYRKRWVDPLTEKIVPIRMINGVDDPISGGHAADRFAEVVPDADIVRIRNSGHYPHVETPDEVLEAFLDFHGRLIL